MIEISQDVLKKQHCGMIAAGPGACIVHMPDLKDIILSCPAVPISEYLFDIKVHMLMPGQWPCIPNWHCDFVPRDVHGNLQPHLRRRDAPPMWLYVSGHPFTEFRDGRTYWAGEWVRFTQFDEHRGTASDRHCWRLFIRAAHESIVPQQAKAIAGVRRHSQVYLDANNFTW